jgi:hypothetical protein
MLNRFGHWLLQQRKFQRETYGHDMDKLSRRDRIDFIRVNNLAAHTELAEALQCLDWKPWRSGPEDRDAAVMELVDTLFFVGNQLIALHVTDDELNSLYEQKTGINQARQEPLEAA